MVSGKAFVITDDDKKFYAKMGVPEPTLCPEERHRRRHAFINDYNFYKRKCDKTGKAFISIFPPKSEYRVLSQEAWFSDDRDDKAEGRDFDFSRSFFEQFDELMHEAPQLGIIGMNNENCDYCESVANCRNCYLISECSNCEDCAFSYWIQKSHYSFDCFYGHGCQWCYNCMHCRNGYELLYSAHSDDCAHSFFLEYCQSCRDCIGCVNLQNKQYYIFNKPYSKEVYEQKKKEFQFHTRSGVIAFEKKFQTFLQTQPRKALQITQTEGCSGNYIQNAKNCREVFHCYDAEECRYGEHVWRGARYCVDSNSAGRNAELLYETTNSGIDSYNVKYCRYCWGCKDTEYSNQCKNSQYLFGCVSLKPNNKYCILNKQYTKEKYFRLRDKIIEHMKQTGEWGEFFPLSLSLFGYNDSVSGDEMPLSKEEVLERGGKWQEDVPESRYEGALYDIPDSIVDVPEDILRKVLVCKASGKHYRLIKQELDFYKKLEIPVPDVCFHVRLRKGIQRSFPMKPLYERVCEQCHQKVRSMYKKGFVICPSCIRNLIAS